MLDLKMKESCRICARELLGNQRRWIFHPASKLNLQVLLSHALGRELTRDGRGEFACSKCAFMLERMYRFDTVVARVEALSIERLQRLLQEKHRLRQCIGGLYRKTNGGEREEEEGEGGVAVAAGPGSGGMVDMSGLTHAKYCALLQEDLVYSLYESWADNDDLDCHHPQCPNVASTGSEVVAAAATSHRCSPAGATPRRCRGCAYWRVADSDYEAVCKVPRKLARSTSCGPSTRYSASVAGGGGGGGRRDDEDDDTAEDAPSSLTLVPGSSGGGSSQDPSRRASDSDRTLAAGGRASSSPSVESLETAGGELCAVMMQSRPSSAHARRGAPPCFLGDPLLDDRMSDSLSEEHVVGPAATLALPSASRLSLALGLLQTCGLHRPLRSPKGSKLPVLVRQEDGTAGNGSVPRLAFPDPVLMGMSSFGGPDVERGGVVHDVPMTSQLGTGPLIRLDAEMDRHLDLAEMAELWEDLYKEYPPPRPHQSLVEEQQSQLNQYECAAGQCVSELQKAQLQVQSLQAKIHESEANNTKLQEKLTEMECELRSIRQDAQNQERTIQDLTDSVGTKDNEAQELYQLIEGQNATLCKLREMAHRNQLTQSKASSPPAERGSEAEVLARLQGELVGVQSSLFSLGLELEASQRSLRQSQRRGDDLATFKDRLHSDLQEGLQHREATDKHNQDLRSALQRVRSELQAKEAALKESEAERHAEVQERERSDAQLKRSLQDKEKQLQEYSEMLESAESCKPRDALLEKLRERIKNRDKALERSIDEKFRCLEDKEGQVRRLQLAIREKERDLDRLRSILSNNEETITSLDSLVRGKELQLEQAAEAYRNLQWLRQQGEEKERTALRERDAVVSQLQAALQTRSQEAQDVTAALLSRVQAGPTEVVEELKARLALKEKLFQELLSDRSRQSADHQAQVQDLLGTIGAKDQYLQDCSDRLAQVIDERTGQLQELRRQLSSAERELSDARREKEREREAGGETELLRSRLREKEALIKELMQGQEEESMESSCREGAPEVEALQEELGLVLKKEREAQKELCAVRASLAQVQQQAKQSASEDTEHQCVLDQIVSEYHQLNDALRAEKRLYQSLGHIHTRGDGSSEKTRALHTELDSVQALRGQLEEVLARTRDTAVALERAAQRRPADFGELSAEEDVEEEDEEGDDEEGSSDEFSDSIEDDGVKVTARSLQASAQTSGMTRCGPTGFSGGPAAQSQESVEETAQLDARQLEGQREELEEMRSQLERDGYSSLAHMRSALLSLQRENQALREIDRGRPEGPLAAGGLVGPEEDEMQQEEEEEEEEDYVEEEEEGGAPPPAAVGKRGPPRVTLREGRGKRQCTRPHSLDLGSLLSHRQPPHSDKEGEGPGGGGAAEEVAAVGRGFWQHVEEGLREQAAGLRADLALCRQENRELQERLMVSEATAHAQAEQLNDYRDLLSETSVQQASKQVQVDLQDLGYETCGRSENEAEREDTSSPEFDDLEMCTSLSNPQDYESVVGGGWYQDDQSHAEGSYDLEEEEEEEEEEEQVEQGGGGAASLQKVVRDLRSQLSRCHKVIRGLQLRIRSLSATSDYASSLERTPRKVNWAFEASPAPSGVEEDEGWMSDSLATRTTEPKSNRELRELVSRVTSLEAQLKLQGKGLAEEGKCATWPGKYNTLIQAQARELSHLRQRMREGRGVCHILTQHLGDTTKAFEELLRANDIDYYMGQSFREQLAQSTALAQRVGTKISGRDRAEAHDDKAGHELLALRLSKELQQKDKIIESLHTKLQQRPETPSSCHALSETTDQSDRTSMVSDECRTHEDLDLCSDLDAASEYAEPGHGSEQEEYPSIPPPPPPPLHGLKSSTSCPNMLSSNPLGFTNQTLRARLSGPVFHGSLPGPLGPVDPASWGPHVTWEPPPRALSVTAISQEVDSLHRQMSQQHRGFVASRKAMSALTLGGHNQHDLSSHYGQLSHHAFQPYQLGVVPECTLSHSLQSDSGLLAGGGGGGAPWDMESGPPPLRGYMGSTGQISVNSHGGIDLIEEHLREVRCLRQRLEESIRTNERLRQQLEERLAVTGRDGGAPTNIYIQGLDTVTQLSNEIRVLKEENLALQSRLQANSDTCEEVAQLREAVLAGRARLKQAELEAEQWKEELRRLQTHSQEQGAQITALRHERQAGQDKSNRLQHEASLLQQQLCESRDLIHSLQSELHVYDRVCAAGTKQDKGYSLCELPLLLPVELGELLAEVRSLRAQLQSSVQENVSALRQLELHKQLEQKLQGGGGGGSPRTPSSLVSVLTASPQRDHFYRRQLLHDPAPSPPVRDIGLFNCGSPYAPYSDLDDGHCTANDSLDPHSELEGEAPDGSFANRNGRHTIGHVDDFSALQQQVLEGRSLVQRMETTLQGCLSQSLLEANQDHQISDLVLDYGCVKSLLSNTKTLRQILEEAVSLLKMFWRAALPSSDRPAHHLVKEHGMQEEILSLRLRMSEQEEVLQGTIQRLRSTSRTKESMEHFIVNQLSRTRDVLKKARTNLELKTHREVFMPGNGLLIGVS